MSGPDKMTAVQAGEEQPVQATADLTAIKDEAIAALQAQAWTEPRREEDWERAVGAVLSLTRDTDGNDIPPESEIPVGEISRVVHEALGEQRVLVHCISAHGFGADWDLAGAIKAVREARNVEWRAPWADHGLRITDQGGKRWLFGVRKPEPVTVDPEAGKN